MRGTRWLLLVAIAAIIFGVGVTYQRQVKFNQQNAVKPPAPLPDDVSSTAPEGQWTKKDQKTGCTGYELDSKDYRQAADSTHIELKGVKLRLFHKSTGQCDVKFDMVTSDSATYFPNEDRLFADSDVTITLAEPTEGQPPPNLVSIKTSGVNYDAATGKADTDRYATFVFKNGDGHATGATYDPPSKLLLMKNDVVVDWQADTPNAKPLHIEAPSLQYQEDKSEVDLIPRGKMTRDELTFEGENPIIRMRQDDKGNKFIKEIDATHAHGNDATPGKKLAYAADRVWVFYNDNQVIERMVIEGNADLTSTAETSETHVTGNHVEMYFDAHDKVSQLARVVCNGNAVVASNPVAASGRPPGDSHVLRSDNIEMKMRPGGREIQTVSARPSGTLEFLPNQPDRHHRTLHGDEMLINYAAQNRVESFHASNVKTTTDPTVQEKQRNRGASTTASRDMNARFNPQTGDLEGMDQTGSFSYQEGDRKASATKATFDQKTNVMTLDTKATVSDGTGTTSADHIRLDQSSGDFVADGNITSSRQPDRSQKGNSGMLSDDAPLNATARKMESSNRAGNRHTRYEGGARLWQGANSINAETVTIDREKHTIVADGNVLTQVWEQPKDDEKKKGGTAVLTKVAAPHLDYADQERLAIYSGGAVQLDRQDLHLKSKQLKAWLAESSADSQLEKAFADGAVQINGARKDNSYSGTSEHAEYYTADQKVILNGGLPKLIRTVKGQQTVVTQPQVTYYVNGGNMVGTGAANDHLPPKKK